MICFLNARFLLFLCNFGFLSSKFENYFCVPAFPVFSYQFFSADSAVPTIWSESRELEEFDLVIRSLVFARFRCAGRNRDSGHTAGTLHPAA